MARDEKVEALKAVSLFSDLSDRELKALAKHTREVWFRQKEEIVTQGDVAGPLFIITKGNATVVVNGRSRRKIGPGGYFGEMALFERQPRTATVRADTEVRALALNATSFLEVLKENWTVTRKVLVFLSNRVRELDRSAND